MESRKKWHRGLLGKAAVCGFLLTVAASLFSFTAACEDLPEHVLRLHVIANSDSPEDQEVKLKVRDAVLQEAEKWYGDADSLEEANFILCTHLESISQAACRVLEENGMAYSGTVEMTRMYFSTREYESFSMPAGKYRTLRITLGEGKGKNWWCVAFPSLCLPAAEKKEEDVLLSIPSQEREIVENGEEYQVKLKVVEWYQQLRSLFDPV